MGQTVRAILLGVVVVTLAIAAIWQSIAHFDLDPGSFLAPMVFLPAPFLLGLFYSYIRKDDRAAAMLLGICFILVYAPIATVLSYFAFNVNGPRIDDQLAAIDRAIGFHWPSVMLGASNHPFAVHVMKDVYFFGVWEIPLLVFLLGWRAEPSDISKFCLSLAVCSYLTIIFWAIWPSFGANTVYDLPPEVFRKIFVFGDANYGKSLLEMYRHGPGRIAAGNIRGVIGFPSYHTVLACAAIWFTRKSRLLRWIFLPMNILVIASTPIQGGHHLVDLVGGIAVSIAGIAIASWAINAAMARDALRMASLKLRTAS